MSRAFNGNSRLTKSCTAVVLNRLLTVTAGVWALALPTAPAFSAQETGFRVHVVDSHFENVAGAVVQLNSVRESRVATTNALGLATFASVPEGRYNVRISATGFLAWQFSNYGVTSARQRPLVATLDSGTLGCDSPYRVEYDDTQLPGPVRGTVIDQDSGKGIGGATIHIWPIQNKKAKLSVQTQRNGRFDLPTITPGRYRLQITDDNHRNLDVTLTVPAEGSLIVSLKLDGIDHVHICD